MARIRARQDELAREKAALEDKHGAQLARLVAKAGDARAAYEQELERWRAE